MNGKRMLTAVAIPSKNGFNPYSMNFLIPMCNFFVSGIDIGRLSWQSNSLQICNNISNTPAAYVHITGIDSFKREVVAVDDGFKYSNATTFGCAA